MVISMSNLTFLEEDQIFGNNSIDQLDIFKNYGTKAKATDYAILSGAAVVDDFYGWYWTKTDDGDNDARVVY